MPNPTLKPYTGDAPRPTKDLAPVIEAGLISVEYRA